MTNLTTDQELRVIALRHAVQNCGESSAADVVAVAEALYGFLVDKRKPLRIGDAHVRLVVDGVDFPTTVRKEVAECVSAEEAARRRDVAR